MYLIEWDDHEGNRHELKVDRLDDAEAEAAALRESFDYVNLSKVE